MIWHTRCPDIRWFDSTSQDNIDFGTLLQNNIAYLSCAASEVDLHARMQKHEISCEGSFKLNSMADIQKVEDFMRNKLFCDLNVPCSVLLTESYRQFRCECCRVVYDAHTKNTTRSRAKDFEVFLTEDWKVRLEGGTVFVCRLVSVSGLFAGATDGVLTNQVKNSHGKRAVNDVDYDSTDCMDSLV